MGKIFSATSDSVWRVPRAVVLAVLLAGFFLILWAPTPTITTRDGARLAMTPEAQRLVGITFLMAGL